jgi:hypothetical protein
MYSGFQDVCSQFYDVQDDGCSGEDGCFGDSWILHLDISALLDSSFRYLRSLYTIN